VYHLTETTLPSNPNFGYSGHDTLTLTIDGGGQFYFEGAELSAWGGSLLFPGAATEVTIQGWLGNNLVGETTQVLSPLWTNAIGFSHVVNRITILPSGVNGGYFRVDDITIDPVPEPTTLTLLVIGCVAMIFTKKRVT